MGKYSDWALKKAVTLDSVGKILTDEQAIAHIELYTPWGVDVPYNVDERKTYNGELYKCLLKHTSKADWTPDIAPSLWVKITLVGEYRVIPEVISATEAFDLGEKGWWKDELYESLIKGNVYTPEAYPAGWKKVEE